MARKPSNDKNEGNDSGEVTPQEVEEGLVLLRGDPVVQFEKPSEQVVETEDGYELVSSLGWIKFSSAFRERMLKTLKGAKLSIFISICLHLNENGESFPSIPTIANETGYHRDTIMVEIQEMEFIPGLMQVIRKTGKANHYRPAFVARGKGNQPVGKIRRVGLPVEDSSGGFGESSGGNLESKKRRIKKNHEEDLSNDSEMDSKKLLFSKLPLLFSPFIHGKLAIKNEYLAHPPNFLLGWITKVYQDRNNLKKPLALLAARLKAEEPPDSFYFESFRQILPAEYLEAVGLAEYACYWCEQKFTMRAEYDEHVEKDHADPQEEEDDPIIEDLSGVMLGSMNAEQVWQSILGQLQMEMPRASFDSYVRDTRPVSFEDGCLSIGVRNPYARDWLESRLASTVNRLIIGIANRSDVLINFVVREVNFNAKEPIPQ